MPKSKVNVTQNDSAQPAQEAAAVAPKFNIFELSNQYIEQLYLGLPRQPIDTSLVDQKVIGAISNKMTTVSNEAIMFLGKNNKDATQHHLHIIRKNAKGRFSLYTVFSLQKNDFATRPLATAPFNHVSVPVLMAAHNAPKERNVGTREKPVYARYYPNANLGNMIRTLASRVITTVGVVGNMSTSLIPAKQNIWTGPYFEQIDGKVWSVDQVINRVTLNVWSNLQMIKVSEEYDSEKDRLAAYQATWDSYLANLAVWEDYGYLTESNAIFPIENGVKPVVTAELGVKNHADEINSLEVYGDAGQMSEVPHFNRAYCQGTLTDATTDKHGSFKYGIYPQNSLRSRDDLVVLTDEDSIKKTIEVCSRELILNDGTGNPVAVSAIVRDVAQEGFSAGTGGLIKRARIFNDIPVGSQIQITGGTITPRYCHEGTLAIRFELTDFKYEVLNNKTNVITGDFSSEVVDVIDLAQAAKSLAMFDNFNAGANIGKPPKATSETAVVQTNANDDEDL